MRKQINVMLGALPVLLAASVLYLNAAVPPVQGADGTPTPVPTVETNAGWEPVIQEFDGIEMVLVPPGCFMMGASEGEFSDMDEEPVHEQCFDAAFWIDRTEVTRVMYAECVADDACTQPKDSRYSSRDEQPINQLTWFQAVEYCAWREARLPTEREWEYAARGPDNLRYPWGDQFELDYVVVSGNATETADVGSLPEGASWVGALDMGGNVFEWVSSHYESYPYDPDDGREAMDDTTTPRIWRGGSFLYDDDVRGANREVWKPDRGNDEVGVRCARDITAADE